MPHHAYFTTPYHIIHTLPYHAHLQYHNTRLPGRFFWTTSRLINGLFHTIHNIPYTNIQYTFNPIPYHTLNTIIIITVAVVIIIVIVIIIIIVIIILTIGTVRLLDVNRERGLVWRPREDHSPYFPFYHHPHHHCLFCLHHNHDMDFSRQKCKKLIIKLFYLCLARIFLFLFSGQDFMISCWKYPLSPPPASASGICM